jgi:NAD(P)-dependent dehydrogenase (short-subunit alcohol dehydrogenase family)
MTMDGTPLSGKVAVVTGAGSGLGRGAAVAFAAAGASVVVNDLSSTAADETVGSITDGGGRACAHVGDVSVRADVEALVACALERFGGLDVMHANAAVSVYRDLAEVPETVLSRIIDVNFKGPLLCAQSAIPALRRRGGGSIIFVSSVQGFQGLPGCVPYAVRRQGSWPRPERCRSKWAGRTYGSTASPPARSTHRCWNAIWSR